MSRTDTRARILAATLEALKTKGFAATSTRAIGRVGGFNPALIFYYFDSLDDLLVAALEQTSVERLERFRPVAEATESLAELVQLLSRIYREDVESGHIRVVSELIGGSVARPELGPRIVELMEPWVALAESAVGQALAGSPASALVSPRELALAGVTFYLGANLLTHLVPESGEVGELLYRAEQAAPLLDVVLPPARDDPPDEALG